MANRSFRVRADRIHPPSTLVSVMTVRVHRAPIITVPIDPVEAHPAPADTVLFEPASAEPAQSSGPESVLPAEGGDLPARCEEVWLSHGCDDPDIVIVWHERTQHDQDRGVTTA
ncbi:hypothetical protein ACH4UR_37390, partial [Streptomyces lydicus]